VFGVDALSSRVRRGLAPAYAWTLARSARTRRRAAPSRVRTLSEGGRGTPRPGAGIL